MNIIQTFERVEKLHLLIANKRTGKPDELARRLGISRATLYNMIEELKSYNLPISYSKMQQSFYYEKDVKLSCTFSIQLIENQKDLIQINGGSYISPISSESTYGINLIAYSHLLNTKSIHRL